MTSSRSFYKRVGELPPREAWKQPDSWVYIPVGSDRTHIKRSITKLRMPIDDRGFVKIEEAIAKVKDLFWEDYDWPITAEHLKPDIHHFYTDGEYYKPKYWDGDTTAFIFRELPVNKGKMFRSYHNVWHSVMNTVTIPPRENMAAQIEGWRVAVELFSAAVETVEGRGWFHARREDIRKNPSRLSRGRTYDEIGEEYLLSNFQSNFGRYAVALDQFNTAREQGLELPQVVSIDKQKPRPDHVIAKFGKIMRQQCVNYNDLIRGIAT